MIKAVLFDNDGTLVDTYQIILVSMRHTMRELLGKEFSDEELMQYVGTPLDEQMITFAGGDRELGAKLSAFYRAHNDAVHDANIKPFPEIIPLLQELQKRGIRIGIVTAKLSGMCKRGLELTGLAPYIETVVSPDVFPAAKPDPAPVVYGCKQLGCDPSECLYVGDSPYDMQAGNGAGCKTVAALWGMFPADVLHAQHPTYELDHPAQILTEVIDA